MTIWVDGVGRMVVLCAMAGSGTGKATSGAITWALCTERLRPFVRCLVPRETSNCLEGGAQRTENVRSEDEDADDRGAHGGDQDPAGGHVLGVSDEGVKLWRRSVGEELGSAPASGRVLAVNSFVLKGHNPNSRG